MKYLMFLSLIAVAFIYGCKKDEPTPKELILGVWVGVEKPELDTMIFYDNDSIRFSRWGAESHAQFYTIDDIHIQIFDPVSLVTSSHGYEFRENDKVYIKNLKGIIFGMDDGGIEFKKL